MEIYVKPDEMPKSCDECMFFKRNYNSKFFDICFFGVKIISYQVRDNKCPLKELPKVEEKSNGNKSY